MGTVRHIGSLLVAMGVVVVMTGCVGKDEHMRVEFALRKCQEKNEELARDLEDARTQAGGVGQTVFGLENQLGAQKARADSLEAENRRLNDSYAKLQGEFDAVIKKLGMPKPIVVERMLPVELDQAIKQFAEAHADTVEYDEKRGVVKWRSDLVFALGSDVVKQEAIEALTGFAGIVNSAAAAEFEVIVVGHTDNVPIGRAETRAKHPTNWHLSAHRAIAVMNALGKAGVAPDRLGVMGYGEHRPIADNNSDAGKQQNRRVELFLVPSGAVSVVNAAPPEASGK